MLSCEVTSVATTAASVHPGGLESAGRLSVLQLYFTFSFSFQLTLLVSHAQVSHLICAGVRAHTMLHIQVLQFIHAFQIFGTGLFIVRPPPSFSPARRDTFFPFTPTAPRVQQEPGLYGNTVTKCQSALWTLCLERSARHPHMLPSRHAAS